MRGFSEFEKKLIRKIVNTSFEEEDANGGNTIMRYGSTILKSFFNCVGIEIAPDKKSFIMYSEPETEKLNLTDLFDALFLIRYLEDNQYLGLDQFPMAADKTEFISPKFKKEGKVWFINDENPKPFLGRENPRSSIPETHFTITTLNSQLAAEVQRFCSSVFYPTNALIDFAKDFKTPEMRIAEKQIKINRWAVGIAFFVGFISILISIFK
ncbi:MAG TPA: hypothetical protein PLQ82_11280 [Desulfobacteraceae bacterium]|nr:hypothetical protein [Desulfobacteraceae bacterium]HRW94550.1 hypothetical protein [Bacteroidales bacterium]